MIRARLLIPLLVALISGPVALRPVGLMGAEKSDNSDDTKTSTTSSKKKKSKSTDTKETKKGGDKNSDGKTAAARNSTPPKDAKTPKDVTDQTAGRTKDSEGSLDARTMEGRHDGEFEHDEPAPKNSSRNMETLTPKADLAGWEVVHYQDREYVSSVSIHRFYRFSEHKVEGHAVWFISPVLIMRGTIGSQDLMINNIKFLLSYPIEEVNGKVLISRLDLCKLIDPVLRPSYIGTSNSFDTVIIDAGHGGHDSGARGIYGYEKDFALKLALDLKADLEKRGLKVVMTRKDDTFISLGGRVEYANKIPNSIFVALHFNSGRSEATGIETWALSPQGSSSEYGARSVDNLAFHGNQRDSENIALATAVHAAVVHHFKMVDRGVKRARWYVLTGLERPGILFEGGFVTNPSDARLIAADNFRKELAHTIGDAITNYRRALKPPAR
jgi:N-acetylmuramoyl-L-alanine amidase